MTITVAVPATVAVQLQLQLQYNYNYNTLQAKNTTVGGNRNRSTMQCGYQLTRICFPKIVLTFLKFVRQISLSCMTVDNFRNFHIRCEISDCNVYNKLIFQTFVNRRFRFIEILSIVYVLHFYSFVFVKYFTIIKNIE